MRLTIKSNDTVANRMETERMFVWTECSRRQWGNSHIDIDSTNMVTSSFSEILLEFIWQSLIDFIVETLMKIQLKFGNQQSHEHTDWTRTLAHITTVRNVYCVRFIGFDYFTKRAYGKRKTKQKRVRAQQSFILLYFLFVFRCYTFYAFVYAEANEYIYKSFENKMCLEYHVLGTVCIYLVSVFECTV